MIHSFHISDAQKYGIEAAVILFNFRYWIEKNKANRKHFYDGHYWTYNTQQAMSELFPYMSRDKVGRVLRHLEDVGVIKTGCYNKLSYDRTKWYTVLDFPIVQNCTINSAELHNQLCGTTQPIPDINTDIDTDKLSDSANQTTFVDSLFDKFWKHYNCDKNSKVKKKDAAKSFARLMRKKSEEEASMLTNAILTYYQDHLVGVVFGADKLHPTTYLNQQRWEDNPEFMIEFKKRWESESE